MRNNKVFIACDTTQISEIKKIIINDTYLEDNFEINYNKCKSVSVGSLNTYYSTQKIKSVPYMNYEQFIKNENTANNE